MRSATRSLRKRERSLTSCPKLRAEQREQPHGQHVLLRVLAAQRNLFNTAPEQLARLACAIGGTALRSAHGAAIHWSIRFWTAAMQSTRRRWRSTLVERIAGRARVHRRLLVDASFRPVAANGIRSLRSGAGAPILIRNVRLGGSLAGNVSCRLSSIWSEASSASWLRDRTCCRPRAMGDPRRSSAMVRRFMISSRMRNGDRCSPATQMVTAVCHRKHTLRAATRTIAIC